MDGFVEHTLVHDGVIDEEAHDRPHSHDELLSRADYIAMLIDVLVGDHSENVLE
jgi:hypothetical protein